MHLHALSAILEKRESKLFCSVLPFCAFQHVFFFFQKKNHPGKPRTAPLGPVCHKIFTLMLPGTLHLTSEQMVPLV